MINVTKEKNWAMNDIINVQTNEGNFYILFERDLNLYFSYLGNNLDDKDEYSFIVNMDDSFLYKCFDELYDSIQSEIPFKHSEHIRDIDYIYPLSNVQAKLVGDNGKIEWHSDDEKDYDLSSVLTIDKDLDCFIVTFRKSKVKVGDSAYSVCIKNGGSKYDPYNSTFMSFYNKLRKHDFELNDNLDKGYSRKLKR